MDKESLRKTFEKEWEKHYNLEFFREEGFVRKRCSCGRYFWTLDPERSHCGEPEHTGYTFVGKAIGRKKSYTETWEEMAHFYSRHGHGIMDRYPVVARWRDDLYFTIASITVFQPYVVRGDVEPPTNPLLIPQPSLRFKDIENVGLTGRHFTSFVMVGQHAFNREKPVLWKEEAIRQIFEYMTKEIGISPESIVFHEDVWMGGGNFGPSLEYFVEALELGNIVFMQYEEGNPPKELSIKVIDHGIGLSRFAWIRSDKPTPYDVVLPRTVEYLKDATGVEVDEERVIKFIAVAGQYEFEGHPLQTLREIEKVVGPFVEEYLPLADIYTVADHAKTLLFAINDGAFPSNVGGGYNLRVLARRIFSIIERRGWSIDYHILFERISEDQKIFPELRESVDLAVEVMEEERKKYLSSRARGKRKLLAVVKRKGELSQEDMKLLYESYGVTPEDARQFLLEEGISVSVPDIYRLIGEPKKKKKEKKKIVDISGLPPTELLYYKDPYLLEFVAKVLDIRGEWVILDRTAFYPEGGGQEADKGLLNGVKVIDVQKVGGVVLHRVTEPGKFKKGDKVKGFVDAERRKALMRHHTATHIILAAARRVLGRHVWQEGAHKAVEKAHIDISHFKRINKEELRAIEREANKIVMENRKVRTFFLDRSEAEKRYGITIYQGGAVPGKILRIVEIEDVDVEACGGTHVRQTGEVGLIKIIRRSSVADGIERIEFVAGERAVEYVEKLDSIVKNTSEVLGCGPGDLVKTASSILQRLKAAEKEMDKLREEIAEILSRQEIVVLKRSDPKLAQLIYKKRGRSLIVVAKEGSPNIMLFGEAVKLAEDLKRTGAKGGGKGDRIFLTVSNPEEVLKKLKEGSQKS